MLASSVIVHYRNEISDLELEIQRIYKRRDEFSAQNGEWWLSQQIIDKRLKRLSWLRSVLEKMMEETLPQGAWGLECNTTRYAA
jgi:hypothetical protein